MSSSRHGQGLVQPLFTWRSAVASKYGPASPTTRLVLLTISLHMNEKGESAFPSLTLLEEETGLNRSTITRNLAAAEQEGWIRREQTRRPNGAPGPTIYTPTLPPGVGAECTYQNGERAHEVGAQRTYVGAESTQVGAQCTPNSSDNSSELATTTPLYPPAGSQPVEGETDSPAPAATPAPTTPAPTPEGGEQPDPEPAGDDLSLEAIAARAGMTTDELHAATQRIITAANRAQRRNPHIDQSSLRPLPDSGPSRQEVYGWLTEGIPVETIVEAVQEVASQYRPDGYRRQISTMTYFSARVREKNELRLADEAEGYDDQRRAHRDDRRGVSAEGRRGREAPGRRRVSKYDEFTIRSAGEVA